MLPDDDAAAGSTLDALGLPRVAVVRLLDRREDLYHRPFIIYFGATLFFIGEGLEPVPSASPTASLAPWGSGLAVRAGVISMERFPNGVLGLASMS